MSYRERGASIERVMRIPGVVVPAFIHNASYFFVNLPIYADGLVDAWDLVDLPLLENKLRSGWLTTRVPDGEIFSAHGLGGWRIDAGMWDLGPQEFFDLIRDTIRKLNPELRNLYDCAGTTTKKVGRVNVSVLGMPTPTPTRPESDSPVSRAIRGQSLSVLAMENDELYLADLRVFEDDTFEIGRVPTSRLLDRAELEATASTGEIRTSVDEGQRMHILGLGSFVVVEELYATKLDQLLLETRDIADEMNHRPNSVAKCREAFKAYLAAPSKQTKAVLRSAYEAIPEHNRRYVGDMDTQDVPVRMAIYGEEELESWSHRVVARAEGIEPLPTITIPQVDDEDDG